MLRIRFKKDVVNLATATAALIVGYLAFMHITVAIIAGAALIAYTIKRRYEV